MARRIDIELTSARPDGSWTWRAAGALKPRGVLDGTLLSRGAKPGDVLRVDAEFEMDGITIVAVLPPKEKKAEPERLEIIGPPRAATPDVTTTLARPLRDGDDSPRRPRRDGGPARNGAAPSGRRDPREGGENPDRPARPARSEGSDRGAGGARPPRQDRARIDRGSRPGGPVTTGAASGGERRPGGAPTRGQRPPRDHPAGDGAESRSSGAGGSGAGGSGAGVSGAGGSGAGGSGAGGSGAGTSGAGTSGTGTSGTGG
ncbi:MAG: hypothetical protein QOF30_61, partial [Acidimicrobiaceae bacterium]|nr:hypothetical protein [Acidimicrobiaceae bacterium]